VLERKAIAEHSAHRLRGQAGVAVRRPSRGWIDRVIAPADAVRALHDAPRARGPRPDLPENRFYRIVLNRCVRQAARAARDVDGIALLHARRPQSRRRARRPGRTTTRTIATTS